MISELGYMNPGCIQVPVLYNLSERQLWQLAKAMVTQKCSKGQVMFRKGDPGDAFYIIQEGAFTCFDGEPVILALGVSL